MGLLDQAKGPTGGPNRSALKSAFLKDDGDFNDGLARICLFGQYGSGKTVLAVRLALALCPPDKFILFMDSAVGFQSLRNHPDIWAQRHRLKRKTYKGLSMIDMVSDLFDEGDEDFTQYGCIILDEHSSMYKVNLDRILTAAGVGVLEDVNTQPQYLAAQNQMWRTSYNLMSKVAVPMIFVAHMRDDMDNKKRKVIRPAYPPGFLGSYMELLSVCGYMEALFNDDGEYDRTIQVHPTREVTAKTRVDGLPLKATHEDFIEKVVAWVELRSPSLVNDPLHPEYYEGTE